MPTPISSGLNLLHSAYSVEQKKASISQQNISSKNIKGYVAVNVDTLPVIANGGLVGLDTSTVCQKVNEALISTIRGQNSLVSGLETANQFQSSVISLFGDKNGEAALPHHGKNMANMLKQFAISPGSAADGKTALDSIASHVKEINQFANNLQANRRNADVEIAQSITSVNATLERIASLNFKIFAHAYDTDGTALNYVNDRREALQELSAFIKLDESSFKPKDLLNCIIKDTNGNILVQNNECVSFSFNQTYTYTATTTGKGISCTSISGIDYDITGSITANSNDGILKELLNTRDNYIPKIQQELDSYTNVMRDSFNAIHNAGIAMNPLTTMTGTGTIPNAGTGTQPLTLTSTFSGQGTLQLGCANSKTKNLTATDTITFKDGMTVGGLIDAINASSANVTASLTADGQLQLQANDPTTGIVMGAPLDTPALLSGTDTFDSTAAYGVSHFFGLNNLFDTGDAALGSAIDGISANLTVKNAVLQSPRCLSTGTLDATKTVGETVLELGDVTTLEKLANAMNTTQNFNATASVPASYTSLTNYSVTLVQINLNIAKNTQTVLEKEQFILEGYSRTAADISSVNEQFEIDQAISIATRCSYLLRAMSIFNSVEKMVFEQL